MRRLASILRICALQAEDPGKAGNAGGRSVEQEGRVCLGCGTGEHHESSG